MTQTPVCVHEACTCVPLDGGYCSDYCRRTAGQDVVVCGCGHIDCAGTAAEDELAV